MYLLICNIFFPAEFITYIHRMKNQICHTFYIQCQNTNAVKATNFLQCKFVRKFDLLKTHQICTKFAPGC